MPERKFPGIHLEETGTAVPIPGVPSSIPDDNVVVEAIPGGVPIPGVPTGTDRIERMRKPRLRKDWVTKFDAPDLDATPNEVPIEPIELPPDDPNDDED